LKPSVKRAVYVFIVAAVVISASLTYLTQVRKVDEYEEEVKKLFEEVRADISRIRNLTASEPVAVKIVDKRFFEAKAEGGVDELKAAREALYKALLLAPKDFSIARYERERAGLVIAASSAYTLYIVRDYFSPGSEDSRRVLAHEYMHILQYNRVRRPQTMWLDAQLAWSAFIEGEADFVADLYTSNKTGRISLAQPNLGQPKDHVDTWFIDRLTYFPYIFGERFVYTLYLAGGWGALNRAYLNPPSSTAEILNPDLYLKGFKPRYPQNPKPVGAGWRIYYPDVLGAFFLNLFLTRTLGQEAASKIAPYWLGDNSTLYLSGGDHLLYWQIELADMRLAETVKQMLKENLLKEASAEAAEILQIDSIYITILNKGSNLLVVSASNLKLAEEALDDLLKQGYA
jgi:predicted DNA-binding ArsR family transcriptional regulator